MTASVEVPSKTCECGTEFHYDDRRGPAEWARRRFCSRFCGGWYRPLAAAQVDPDASRSQRLGWTQELTGGAA